MKNKDDRIVDAIRGTSASNRTEWLVLVPLLIIGVFALIGFFYYFMR
jgi:hypothetical protein